MTKSIGILNRDWILSAYGLQDDNVQKVIPERSPGGQCENREDDKKTLAF